MASFPENLKRECIKLFCEGLLDETVGWWVTTQSPKSMQKAVDLAHDFKTCGGPNAFKRVIKSTSAKPDRGYKFYGNKKHYASAKFAGVEAEQFEDACEVEYEPEIRETTVEEANTEEEDEMIADFAAFMTYKKELYSNTSGGKKPEGASRGNSSPHRGCGRGGRGAGRGRSTTPLGPGDPGWKGPCFVCKGTDHLRYNCPEVEALRKRLEAKTASTSSTDNSENKKGSR